MNRANIAAEPKCGCAYIGCRGAGLSILVPIAQPTPGPILHHEL